MNVMLKQLGSQNMWSEPSADKISFADLSYIPAFYSFEEITIFLARPGRECPQMRIIRSFLTSLKNQRL